MKMRAMCVHAHYDDYEFVAAGLFELWRRKGDFEAKLIVCTDGAAGHQYRTRAETGAIRIQEQTASAQLGGYSFDALKLPDGTTPREGGLQVSTPALAGLWKQIRDFEPDYLFAPPVPIDPLAGIHVDHVAVADLVRRVAYLINVPHAFTPEYPADETKSTFCKTPVILALHDAYMSGSNAYDIAIDVEDTFELMAQMTHCHQCQIAEWLPWIARHDMPAPTSMDDWKKTLRRRFTKRNREMGVDSDRVHEFYTVTAWGEVPTVQQIEQDFPGIAKRYSHLEKLKQRLNRWRGEE